MTAKPDGKNKYNKLYRQLEQEINQLKHCKLTQYIPNLARTDNSIYIQIQTLKKKIPAPPIKKTPNSLWAFAQCWQKKQLFGEHLTSVFQLTKNKHNKDRVLLITIRSTVKK